MAKSNYEIAVLRHTGKRLTKKNILPTLENEINIKNKCFSFLIDKGLYDEFHNYEYGKRTSNDKSALAFEAIGLITGTLNLQQTSFILSMLLTHYLVYEDGLSTEHKEDVSFTVRILNEAISTLTKAQ